LAVVNRQSFDRRRVCTVAERHTRKEKRGGFTSIACLAARPGERFLYDGVSAIRTSMLRMNVSKLVKEEKEGEMSVYRGRNCGREGPSFQASSRRRALSVG